MAGRDDRSLGATRRPDGRVRFRVWAPHASDVRLHLLDPIDRLIPLAPEPRGYFAVVVDEVSPGARYRYRLDGSRELPDPASRFQPEGVHGPSAVVDPAALPWAVDHWQAPTLPQYVIDELHVGTFTPEGTFDGAITQLDRLVRLGITAIELMPIAQFPGARNWGYDGVYPFAVQSSYGGPAGLQRFVDACHARDLAVILDVVYNHLGPEGNYLEAYGDYFTDRYHTPWGRAINFDGPGSDEVRHYFIENTISWLVDYRIDAFRLDAVHAIIDTRAPRFLAELAASVHETAERLGRRAYVIAESDPNDPRLVTPRSVGGDGFDAQWSDDFHHALHTALTGEHRGYYADFRGLNDLARAFRDGYVHAGRYSEYHHRSRGAPPTGLSPWQFVVFAQNHDQIGNRAKGERLSELLSFAQQKLAAAALLLSPFVPLLFMGEAYGARTPFQYFTSHSDADLVEAVRRGRREEFAAFGWASDVPDPQSPATFDRSTLLAAERERPPARTLAALHAELIRLRRTLPALQQPAFDRQQVSLTGQALRLLRWFGEDQALVILNVGEEPFRADLPPDEAWTVALDTDDARWGGARPGAGPREGEMVRITVAPVSAVVLTRRVTP